MSEMVWENPPGRSPKHEPGEWEARLNALLTNPKTWARVGHVDTAGQAQSASQRLRRTVPNVGDWEVVTRKVPDGGYGVYARYMGPPPGGIVP